VKREKLDGAGWFEIHRALALSYSHGRDPSEAELLNSMTRIGCAAASVETLVIIEL
jgi:hypothetical protein